MQPVHLDVQQQHAQADPRRADQIEFGEPHNPFQPGVRTSHQPAKGPDIIPDKIIDDCYLRRDDLAQAQVPAQHGR